MRTLVTADNWKELSELLDVEWDYIVVDTETDGLTPFQGSRIIGISLYFPSIYSSYYIPIRHQNEWNLPYPAYTYMLERLPNLGTLVFFNAKFDLHMLHADGMNDPAVIEDVMLAAQILNENEEVSHGQRKGAYSLKRLASKYLGSNAQDDEKEMARIAKERGLNPKSEMWKLEAEIVAPYAMGDVEITWGLRQHYIPALEKWGQRDFYHRRSEFVLKALLRMERNGMYINAVTLAQHQREIEPRTKELQAEFDDYMRTRQINLNAKSKKDERQINLSSPQQVKIFFKDLLGYNIESTDALTMQSISEQGEKWADKLLEYRRLSKANSTYYEPYLSYRDWLGFIHPNLNAIGAETGRLSSDSPNFQNIPRNGRYKVKEVFEPRPGYALVTIDYKQLELRLGVHYSNEITMRDMFNAEIDMHQWTADRLGITRQFAKNYNFGLIYGMGWRRAMHMFSIKSESEAKKSIEGWHKLYPAFREALSEWEQKARLWRNPDGTLGGKFKFVRLMNNRVRHYQELEKAGLDYFRDAWNFQVQGTAGAVVEESILRIVEAFPDNDIIKPVLTVHDNVVLEIKLEYLNASIPVIEGLMTDWPMFNPNLAVDTKATIVNWYDGDVTWDSQVRGWNVTVNKKDYGTFTDIRGATERYRLVI